MDLPRVTLPRVDTESTTVAAMIEANRANWDARVRVHLRGYDLDHLRAGGQRLADSLRAVSPRRC